MKREYSFGGETTRDFDSQSQEQEMPYKKTKKDASRSKSGRGAYKSTKTLVAVPPRTLNYNSIVIPRIVDYDVNFSVDVAHGFGFSHRALWVNGVSTVAMPGINELSDLFELCRVVKVEVTILPGNNMLGYGTNSLSTGLRNIPFLYEAVDPNDSTNPGLDEIRQVASCRTHLMDKAIRRTIYPCYASGSVIEIGANRQNRFVNSSSNVAANGYKVYADLVSEVLTYDRARLSFKVFIECKSPR